VDGQVLPSGVVTFVLTDVVGSTRLWQRSPNTMDAALARHGEIIETAVAAHAGVVLKARGEGDSTFCVFARASNAVRAALDVQRALTAEPWPSDACLSVRVAIHSGEAIQRDDDYLGPAVNRVARLRALASGGEVLLSGTTADLVVDDLPADVRLVELGAIQLRDLDRAERVFGLVADGIAAPVVASPPEQAPTVEGATADEVDAPSDRVIRVVVADDQALVRSGFTVLLRSAPDIDVVGEAANGREAVDVVTRQRPDVILMDIRMPEMDGLEATRRITADEGLSSTRVLILTTFDLDENVFAALRAGASGFLLKDTLPSDLLAAVRVVAAGEALLAPSVTRRMMEEFARQPTATAGRPPPGLDLLTTRETEVLAAVANGLSNAEIAEKLFMSHATAKTHVSRLLTKLHARDRAQLVMLAYEAGVVLPASPGVSRRR
jgi:DNA-binding NarL/FixJ family response regulator/class 3 adenylate cyclase